MAAPVLTIPNQPIVLRPPVPALSGAVPGLSMPGVLSQPQTALASEVPMDDQLQGVLDKAREEMRAGPLSQTPAPQEITIPVTAPPLQLPMLEEREVPKLPEPQPLKDPSTLAVQGAQPVLNAHLGAGALGPAGYLPTGDNKDYTLLAAGSAMLQAPTLMSGLGAAGDAFIRQKTLQQTQLDNQRYRDAQIRRIDAEASKPKTAAVAGGAFTLYQYPDGSTQLVPNKEVQEYQKQLIGDRATATLQARASAPDKPLPAGVQKMEMEGLEAIDAADGIASDVDALVAQLDQGTLDLGPVQNRISEARNWMGLSDQNSQAYAQLQVTLERIRNDFLRLNKGVQTEGDAIRAWNEMIPSTNDPAVVRNGLIKLKKANERLVQLQRQRLDILRQNNNRAPMDWSTYQSGGATVVDPSASDPELDDALNQYP